MWRIRLLALCAASAALLPAHARAADPVDEVRDCMRRNIPKRSSVQTVEFRSFDGVGGERTCRGKLSVARFDDGLRRLKTCMREPPEVRGFEFLSIEAPGRAPDAWLYSPDLKKRKRLTGTGLGGSVCGSDVSYEDLERWQQLERPDRFERLPDTELEGEPVFVLQTTPLEASSSHYTKVVSWVDRKTCVVLRSESFENGKLRKVMTASVEGMLEEGGVYVTPSVAVRDERDHTHTDVEVSELEIDGDVDLRSFEDSTLGRHCR